ncbi:hypothetical protein V3C99_014773, partial [Haemonchus contortus]
CALYARNSFCHLYLGRGANIMNYLASELIRTKSEEWGATRYIEGLVKKRKSFRHLAPLIDIAVLPALTYASEIWGLRKRDEQRHSRSIEKTSWEFLYTHTLEQKGIWSAVLRQRTKIRDAVAYAQKSKTRCAGHVKRYRDDRRTRAVTV